MRTVSRFPRCAALAAAVALACCAFAPDATAQLHGRITGADESRTYILNAAGRWDDAQDQAVAQAGGTRVWTRGDLGVGVVRSDDPMFLDKVLAGTAFEGGGEDTRVAFDVSPSAMAVADAAAVTPGDEPYIRTMWNLTAIDAPGAWTQGFDGTGVRVAVLDGGICATHVELRDNLDLAASRSFVPGAGFDSDGPGFMRACHLAGVIAAEDNGFGGIGVAPHATIIACKITDRNFGTFDALMQAVIYAADPIAQGGAGANVILIGPTTRLQKGGGVKGNDQLITAFKRTVEYATRRGVFVVAGVGDDATDLDHSHGVVDLPAQSDHCMGIAATGPEGFAVGYPNGATDFTRPASTSNFGESAVDLAAPGGDDTEQTPLCTMPKVPLGTFSLPCYVFDMVVGPGYVSGSKHVVTWSMGTAVAAAHVAGVAALVKQKYPGADVDQVRKLLTKSADRIDHGLKAHYGHGFLDARLAVALSLDGDAHDISPVTIVDPAPRAQLVAVSPTGTRVTAFVVRLPSAARARLELFDVAGRNVAVLFDGAVAAGQTVVGWDGRGRGGELLRAGAYFARLTAGRLQASRLVLVAN